ncbi:serine--tRNA ligase [Clostridiaceae bacterium AF42-6]|nr:serine--tRNA ligase [Clostridiales bacterium AM23-16LB]RHO83362.1 serine--tRNA ligase [Clostridiaceae bacterium AF42-6]RHP47477.1 serine--tRNA ligase [Clostridiaceae bacterium AF31-3BH]RHQ22842.1 serine--tRNA ligase [Clostridiaceae bacterium AF29-16BH]RHW01416.1 serine--tRNA ligase [Clostridiaceae bacterium OF09-1]
MLDLKFVRENPDVVKQNIKNKFQDDKLPLVDEVIELDAQRRATQQEADALRAEKNKISKQIGALMAQGKKDEAENVKKKVAEDAARLEELSVKEKELDEKVTKIMMVIPNIIDPSVPIGKNDTENVEVTKYGEPVVPDFEIPYHTEIMERFNGIDLDSARRVAGNGFYYLMGDIARLHSAVISYARDFMINRGFTYCVPPFMIRSNVVTGVMSFAEMDAMMYKIEGEDLYLIGTSEHSMIGKFIDQIIPEEELPYTLTSYSPCFRKEKGAHGIEERGVYRIHQFEKQEMIVVCKPEESKMWFDKLWQNTVDLFRSMDIPVRTLECCSGDLADLKVKSFDVEAWSPRQKKYFEVGSCSNLGDAQARRLKIRVDGKDGKYFAHTLNNTVVAPPRMLIAFLENNLQADGSIRIPEVLRPYMGGMTEIK